MIAQEEAKKRKIAMALDSIISRILRGECKDFKRKERRNPRIVPSNSITGKLPGRYVGQAVTLGSHPLTRHYSMVKDQGGGVTFWVFCPQRDDKAHEDESLVQVEDVLEFCENRGLEFHAVYEQLKHLDSSWARQFKKKCCQTRLV